MNLKRVISIASLLVLACFARGVQAQDDQHGWTGDELLTRGAGRLAEVFRTLHPVESWSNDRYSLRVLGSGLGGLHGSGPTVIVDGLPMPFYLFDRSMLEFIPVTPQEIDSVSFSTDRTILPLGIDADGIIRISTKRPFGWALNSSIGLINETGDPGPAIHQDTTLTNVDRSGPVTNTTLSYRTDSWFAQIGLNTDLYHLTDQEISGRQWLVFGAERQPVVTVFAPSARFVIDKNRVQLTSAGGLIRKKDHQFLEIAGWEWPNRQEWTWVKGEGSLSLSENVTAGMRWSLDDISIVNRDSKIELPGKIDIQDLRGESYVSFRLPAIAIEFAGGYQLHKLHQEGLAPVLDEKTRFGRVSAQMGSGNTTWKNVAQLSSGRSSSLQVTSLLTRVIKRGGRIRIKAGYSSGTREHLNSTLGLVSRGITFADLARDLRYEGNAIDSRELELGLFAVFEMSETSELWLELHMRNMAGLTIPDRIISQPFGIGPLLPQTNWSSGKTGWVFSRGLGLVDRSLPFTTTRLSYQFYHVSSEGDTVFWRHFTGYPRHRLNGSVTIQAPERISIFALASVASKWVWPEYQAPARRVRPASIDIEMTVSKGLFASRMHMAFSFLNLLDRDLGNHPAGVFEQFAMRIKLSTRLTSVNHAR